MAEIISLQFTLDGEIKKFEIALFTSLSILV